MEQNKTLLIILSVALFLAAILSVGLWFFYPREKTEGVSAVAEAGKSTTFDPIEWVRTKEDFPALTEPDGKREEDVIIVYGEDPSAPKPSAEAATVPVPAATPAPMPPPPAPKAAAPAPSPAKETVKPAAPAATAAKTARVREYSIQVGSYSSRDRAEEAGRLLREKGLAGQILSREVNGSQFYRLRIGPYTNKAEAEKFLTWVRNIRGFEGSLIFEGYATRPVAN